MSSTDLLCAGESFEDLIFSGLPRLPRLGEELRTKSFARTYGGGATITAVAAARLGVPTTIVSALSDGAVGRLKAEGVHVKNLRRRGEQHAITAALSTPENRAFATFDGVNAVLGPRLVQALSRAEARIAHLPLCPRDIAALLPALATLRSRGTLVTLDFGYDLDLAKERRLPELLAAADFLLINEDEAKLYSGKATLAKAEGFWLRHTRNTVIKMGPRGSRWLSAKGTIEEPAPRVTPVDTTGAGDAFNAGFLAGILSGLSARRCLKLGNAVGARSTRAAGGLDGLPRLEEL